MSSSHDIDPKELTLHELTDDLKLGGGPVIDTSEEFPLPDFAEDTQADPEFLFPSEGEPTTEDVRKDSPLPPLDIDGSQDDELELPSLDDVGKRDWREEGKPLSELSFPSSDIEFSEDDDYFEPKLELVRQPSSDPNVLEPKPPLPPLPGFDPPNPRTSKAAMPVGPVLRPVDEESQPEREQPAQPAVASLPPSGPPEQPGPAMEEKPATAGESAELSKSPVANCVRKVKVKRKGAKKQAIRPWVPVAGLVLLAAGYFASQPFLADLEGEEIPTAVMIVASHPKGEVFLGDQSLGETPIALTSAEVASGMEVRRRGFETLIVPELGQREESKPPQKFLLELQPSPIELTWEGLPEGTALWWNGVKKKQQELTQVQPGTYQVKAKPPGRPAVTVEVALEPGGRTSFDVGQALQSEFAKQPTISVGLALPEKTNAKDLGITVKSLDEKTPFTGTVKVSGGSKTSLVVPEAGKYKLSFAGDKSFKPVSQTVELASGASQEINLTLAKQPPPKVAPVDTGGSGAGYQPSQPYRPYRPPVYRPSGGGGGRIAPPSF